MMTKPDQREQTDTLEDGPVVPVDAQVREQLDVILASDEFSSSRRASELLQHLVERALTGDTASLKERLLGIDIFRRRSDYNTSTDAIVRVTANDVRRRLAQFYTRHPDQDLRISLPLGSYVPDFIRPPSHESEPVRSGIVAVAGTPVRHPEILPGSIPPPAVITDSAAAAASPAPAKPSLLARLLYPLGLLLAVVIGWSFHGLVN